MRPGTKRAANSLFHTRNERRYATMPRRLLPAPGRTRRAMRVAEVYVRWRRACRPPACPDGHALLAFIATLMIFRLPPRYLVAARYMPRYARAIVLFFSSSLLLRPVLRLYLFCPPARFAAVFSAYCSLPPLLFQTCRFAHDARASFALLPR